MNAVPKAQALLEDTPPHDVIRSLGVRVKSADLFVQLNQDVQSRTEASTQEVLSWHEFLSSEVDESIKEKAKKELFSQFQHTHIELGHVSNCNVNVIIFDEEKGQHLTITQHIHNHHHTLLIIPDHITASVNVNTIIQKDNFASGGVTCLAGSDVNLFLHENIASNKKSALLHRSQVFLGKNSYATWFSTFCAKRIIGGIRGVLEGEKANLIATTQTLHKPFQNIDIDAIMEHVAAFTYSDLLCAGLIKQSKVVTRSLVKIHEQANESQGFEKTKYLLLDDTAHAVSIPDLEIHNDQVKCSHGASVSKINPREIFYLQSRGIAKNEARELILSGFVEDVLTRMPRSCKVDVVK